MLPPLVARPPTDPTEERRLRRLANARHAQASWLQRARVVTLSWDGAQVSQLAARLGCHPRTVYRWLHRFNQGGIDDLGDLPRSGRPRRLGELDRGRVIALVGSDPPGRLVRQPDGTLVAADEQQPAQWTLDALAAAAQAEGSRSAAARSAGSSKPKGCAGARCAPGAPAATRTSPPKGGHHRPLHHATARGDGRLRRRARPGHPAYLPAFAGLVDRWPPHQGTFGGRPQRREGLGVRRAAGRRWPSGHPHRPIPQLDRRPAAPWAGGAGQPDGRDCGDHRQPLQPFQLLDSGLAGRAPAHPPGVDPGRRLLAESAGGMVAAVPPRRLCRPELRLPWRDHLGDSGCDLPAECPRSAVGVGAPTALTTLPATRPHLPHLRNGALGRSCSSTSHYY
jgi:transposase